MDRLGILLDAEQELERKDYEKRHGKQENPVPRTVYNVSMGWVFETEIGHHKAVSTPVIELKQGMGRFSSQIK